MDLPIVDAAAARATVAGLLAGFSADDGSAGEPAPTSAADRPRIAGLLSAP